jgi:RNA polymerase sigma-70 factor (ECF subfamily)
VYQRYRLAVYKFCLTQVRDAAAAEDIGADVFEAAFKAYERARPDPDTVHFWLFRIARNKAINYQRRSTRWRAIANLIGRNAAEGNVENNVETRAELREVLESFAVLSTRDRQLVGLRLAGGLSFHEIGEMMGMSERAAMTATHRACQRVRKSVRSAE